MTKHLNPTQKRLAKQMFQSAEQRNSLRKLARMAETLPSMEYEVERLYRDADEMDQDVDHTAGLLIDSGLTVTEISNLDDPR